MSIEPSLVSFMDKSDLLNAIGCLIHAGGEYCPGYLPDFTDVPVFWASVVFYLGLCCLIYGLLSVKKASEFY